MRIRILLLIKIMRICGIRSTCPQGLNSNSFKFLASIVSVQDFSRLHLESIKIPNLDFNADPDLSDYQAAKLDSHQDHRVKTSSDLQLNLLFRVRIRIDLALLVSVRIGNADPDQGESKMAKINKYLNLISSLSKWLLYGTKVDMFYNI